MPTNRDRIIDSPEAKRRATAHIVAAVARCMVLGLRPAAIADQLHNDHREILDVLGFKGVPSVSQVRSWARRAGDEVSTLGEDVKTARAIAVARLDCTVAPLIQRIERAAEDDTADLRAIEQLRRVVATQAEIQGVTRARESLADALEGAMRSLVERSRREGTIRSASPSPPALRAGEGHRIPYRPTVPDAVTVEAEVSERHPGSVATALVVEGVDLATVSRVTEAARGRANRRGDDLPGLEPTAGAQAAPGSAE